MEYSSPLGYNFKLEKSISAIEEKHKETPTKAESSPINTEFKSTKPYHFNHKKTPRNNRNSQNNFSPKWQRYNNNRTSPNVQNFRDSFKSISDFFNPSMLENPWEELEKKLNDK